MGRKAKFVKGPDGKDLYGLSYSAAVKCHYATFSKPRKYFKKDKSSSIFEFHKWKSQREYKNTTMHIPSDFNGAVPIPCGEVDWDQVPHPVVVETYPGETLAVPGTKPTKQSLNVRSALNMESASNTTGTWQRVNDGQTHQVRA